MVIADPIIAERDEQCGYGEPSIVDESGTGDPTLASINTTTSASIDTDSYCRSTPLEILERSSCTHDIADSSLKRTDVSSCYLSLDGDKEITIEDFLEVEKSLNIWIFDRDVNM